MFPLNNEKQNSDLQAEDLSYQRAGDRDWQGEDPASLSTSAGCPSARNYHSPGSPLAANPRLASCQVPRPT